MTIATARTTASARIAVPFPMGVASMAAFLAAATGIHAAVSAAREYPSYLGTQLFCAFRPPRAPCNVLYGMGMERALDPPPARGRNSVKGVFIDRHWWWPRSIGWIGRGNGA